MCAPAHGIWESNMQSFWRNVFVSVGISGFSAHTKYGSVQPHNIPTCIHKDWNNLRAYGALRCCCSHCFCVGTWKRLLADPTPSLISPHQLILFMRIAKQGKKRKKWYKNEFNVFEKLIINCMQLLQACRVEKFFECSSCSTTATCTRYRDTPTTLRSWGTEFRACESSAEKIWN